MPKSFNIYFAVFVIIFLGIAVYANSLKGDFVWDDEDFVVKNDYIKSLKNIPLFFTKKETLAAGKLGGDNYRPLVSLTYALDYSFWKLNPTGYHITNTGLHVLNAILLFYLLTLILKNYALSIFSSIIFLIHPIQTEAVTWISGRSNVLFLFFFLLAFILYIKQKTSKKHMLYAASLISFLCGLLSKETTAVFPLMIILYDWIYDRENNIAGRIVKYMPFLAVFGIYMFIRFTVLGRLGQCDYWTGSLYTTLLTMARVIVYYIRLLLFPVGLCIDYLKYPASYSIMDHKVLLSLIVLLTMLITAFGLRKRNKDLSFGIFWFFIALLPVINIIPVKIFMAERFLYLPSIGFAVTLSAIFYILYCKKIDSIHFKKLLVTTQIILIIACSTLTFLRNKDWTDAAVLYGKAIESYPDNFRARYNLAITYGKRGQEDKALTEMREVERLRKEAKEEQPI